MYEYAGDDPTDYTDPSGLAYGGPAGSDQGGGIPTKQGATCVQTPASAYPGYVPNGDAVSQSSLYPTQTSGGLTSNNFAYGCRPAFKPSTLRAGTPNPSISTAGAAPSAPGPQSPTWEGAKSFVWPGLGQVGLDIVEGAGNVGTDFNNTAIQVYNEILAPVGNGIASFIPAYNNGPPLPQVSYFTRLNYQSQLVSESDAVHQASTTAASTVFQVGLMLLPGVLEDMAEAWRGARTWCPKRKSVLKPHR